MKLKLSLRDKIDECFIFLQYDFFIPHLITLNLAFMLLKAPLLSFIQTLVMHFTSAGCSKAKRSVIDVITMHHLSLSS